ncbi:MAG: crotonase/enoyl-CoA hydratase family protein [Moraxella sp.]|nr:crotonase/enoyl-CoA hydratase family protein [Moraxella sp.]
MSIYQTLMLEYHQKIAYVILNRPDKKNAMNFLMMAELVQVAKLLKKDKTLRAIVMMGAEGQFCSGLDLSELKNHRHMTKALWHLIKPTPSLFQKVCLVWRTMPVPVIAVIEGVCLGAGLQLALACDIRIASTQAQLAVLEAKWGLVADMGLSQTAWGIAPDVLKELMMTAAIIDGQQAKDKGLVTYVHQAPKTLAESILTQIDNRSPDAVLAAKRLVNSMYKRGMLGLYQEKWWQLKLIAGHNRTVAQQKAKDVTISFKARQFK